LCCAVSELNSYLKFFVSGITLRLSVWKKINNFHITNYWLSVFSNIIMCTNNCDNRMCFHFLHVYYLTELFRKNLLAVKIYMANHFFSIPYTSRISAIFIENFCYAYGSKEFSYLNPDILITNDFLQLFYSFSKLFSVS
jgi:hypothetical protein